MKLSKKMFLFLSLSSLLFAGTYKLDKSHSSVNFKVKHMMISNVKGGFDKFDAKIVYDEKIKHFKTLEASVDTSSVDTKNEKRDKHLKGKDFFDVEKFPKITFKLSKTDGDFAYGKLTLNGITKDVKLNFENNGIIKDPWGNQRLGFSLYGKINRTDFGLKYNSALDTGGVAIGENVKIEVDIEGMLVK